MTTPRDGPAAAAAQPTIAVDLGGTKIAVARISGPRILDRRRIPTPRSGRGDQLADAIAAAVRGLGGVDGPFGLATTGIVEDGRIMALNPDTLPIETGYAMAEALAARLGATPLVVNDAQAAAWGEYRFGAGCGRRSIAFITVSTGIGGGFVLDGALQTGRRGFAGHIGHVLADPRGPFCGCGRRGCLEAVASGSALARQARIRPDWPDAEAVFRGAAEGYAEADRLLDRAAGFLAVAIADLVATLDPERVVIGGGVGLAPGFLARVASGLDREPPAFRRPLVCAETGDDAGLLGVADLAHRGFRPAAP